MQSKDRGWFGGSHEYIELDPVFTDLLHTSLLQGGLGFEHNSRGLILVPLENRVVSSKSFGLTSERINDCQRAHIQYLHVAYNTLTNPEGRIFMEKIIPPDEKDLLELKEMTSRRRLFSKDGYISDQSLVRIDHLLDTQSGKLLVCDPNLVPLGMGYTYAYAEPIRQILGDQVLLENRSLYEERLVVAAQSNPRKITGIVTNTKYPLFRSHCFLTEYLRRKYGLPIFTIPTHAVNSLDGKIDLDEVAKLYNLLGYDSSMRGKVDANVLIRYARELGQVNGAEVINPVGVRVLESQVWNALITLNGFDSYYQRITGEQIDVDLHKRSHIPTVIARIYFDKLEIATSINEKGELVYSGDVSNLPGFVFNGHKSQRPNYCGVLKTLSTSGNKGVRQFKEKRGELLSGIKSAFVNMFGRSPGFDEGRAMLIQPLIIGATNVFSGAGHQNHRIDVFLSGRSADFVASGVVNNPVNSGKAHGGTDATYGLLYNSETVPIM